MDGGFNVTYAAGSVVGNQTCFDYPTVNDDLAEGTEVFVFDLISSNSNQLTIIDAFDSTVVQIMDNDSKSSSMETRMGHVYNNSYIA